MYVRRQVYPVFMTMKPPLHLTSWTGFFGTLVQRFLKPINPGLSPRISKVMVFRDFVVTPFCYHFTFRVAVLRIVVVQLNWQPQSFLSVADPQQKCPFCDAYTEQRCLQPNVHVHWNSEVCTYTYVFGFLRMEQQIEKAHPALRHSRDNP
jgi:hypothetical protein